MKNTGRRAEQSDLNDLAKLNSALNKLLLDQESDLNKAIAEHGKVTCLSLFLKYDAQSENEDNN